MKTSLRLALLAAGSLLLTLPAHAAVEFTTFDPGDAYDTGGINTIEGTSFIAGYAAFADEFTASFTGTLSGVDVAVAHFGPYGDGNLALELYQNDPVTNLPLTSGAITLGDVTATNGVVTLTYGGAAIPLVSGVSYWLGLTPADTNTLAAWFIADNQSATNSAMSSDGGATYTAEGNSETFDVNATPALAPEPSTWALLAIGGTGLLAAWAHRRRAPAL